MTCFSRAKTIDGCISCLFVHSKFVLIADLVTNI